MAQTSKKYRQVLKDIADCLKFSDVSTIKFLCQEKIGAGALDEIPNDEPVELFCLLEERLVISENDLTWLKDVLKKIQRNDLAKKITDEFCQQSSTQSDGSMAGPHAVSPYRVLLKTVADGLTRSNVTKMKYLLNVPAGIGQKIHNGQDLLTHLEGSGQLSENNTTVLKDVLSEIYREDLIKEFNDISINEDGASCYPMQRPYGYTLIINNQTFAGQTREGRILPERVGSQVDLKNLADLWKKVGFKVEKYEDLKADKIYTAVLDVIEEIEKTQNSSCFVCCIMTHGAMGKIYGSDSKFVYIKDIINLFKESKTPALAGKPKLFFIQACRGSERLTGQTLSESASSSQGQCDDFNDSSFRHNADAEEDHFLLGYSTASGCASMRDIQCGSWYMNALVEIFGQFYRSESVADMMMRVNGKVSEAYSLEGYKQCPAPIFTLTKKLYF